MDLSLCPVGATATVIVVAVRLRIADIAALARRRFSVVCPAHVDVFTLLAVLL